MIQHFYNTNLNFSTQKQVTSDNEDDNQSLNVIPLKKRSRTIPTEEKDVNYYEKRARNNESAKRSRDARRIREEQIQDRASYLFNENARLKMENETMKYQLSRLYASYNDISKPLQ